MKPITMKIFSLIAVVVIFSVTVCECNSEDLDSRPSLLVSLICLQSHQNRDICFNEMESRNPGGPLENLLLSLKNRRLQKSQSIVDELTKSGIESIKRGADDKDSGFYSNW